MKLFTLLSLTLLLLPFFSGANELGKTPQKQKVAKAIFIIVDGIPADVLEQVHTPNIDDISAVGGYTRAYVGGQPGTKTESPTISAVGYQSLITGTWANKHNVYDNSPKAVNYQYWDIFRMVKHADPARRTAIFSTWLDNRTILIGDGLPQAGGKKLDYHFDGFETDEVRFPHDKDKQYIKQIDELVANEAAASLLTHGPDLSWVYLEYTDDVGHKLGDSPQQIQALEWTDGLVGKIWQSVKNRMSKHNEDWLIIVTTDHGRDVLTGKNHGGQSPRERTTWIATNATQLNTRFRQTPAIVDILPSIATFMNINIPLQIVNQLDGQSFIGEQ